MEFLKKSYEQFQAIIALNSFQYDYEDTEVERIIFVYRNSAYGYKIFMPYYSPGSVSYAGSQCESFDLNYKNLAGVVTYMRDGWQFTATAGAQTNYDTKFKNAAGSDKTAWISRGIFNVGDSAVRGDYIRVVAIDKDNVVGNGANTVLQVMVNKHILAGGKEEVIISPPPIDYFSNRKKVPQGIYFRVEYYSTGGTNVNVILVADLHIK